MLNSETGLEIITDRIHKEMDSISSAAHFQSKDEIDLEYLRKWDVECHCENAPCVYRVLITTAATERQQFRNKLKKPDKVCSNECHEILVH